VLESNAMASLPLTALQFYCDGGPSMGLVQEPQDMLGGLNFSSKVKEQVQALLTQLHILPGYTSSLQPRFVYLLEGEPEGLISCTPHPLKA